MWNLTKIRNPNLRNTKKYEFFEIQISKRLEHLTFGFRIFSYFVFRYSNFRMTNVIRYLFGLFLFIFPLSIRWAVYESASYRFGNFNPWVTGFVHLPEILLGLIFVLWFIQKVRIQDSRLRFTSDGQAGVRIQRSWLWGLFFIFAINAFVVTLLNGDSFLGAMFILRLFEALVVFWLINDKILSVRQMVTILLFGAITQIIWGYAQWRTNGSLGLALLGESLVGPDVLGVAKIDLAEGVKQIRAYGSFLHPNIFAAYLLTIFFVSLRYLKYGYRLLWLALFTWGVYLTHSRAAMLAGLIGLSIYFFFAFFKNTSFRKGIAMIVLLLLVIGNFWLFKNSHAIQAQDIAWQERLEQNVMSQNMWKQNPLGVGMRNFTLEMERHPNCGPNSGSDCGAKKLLPWEFQPVHNTYFLILNEVGIQGLAILIAFLFILFYRYWKAGKAVPLLVLLLLAPFDHFLWDSWVGLMLIAIVAGFFAIENQTNTE